jgi:hypothetical protein
MREQNILKQVRRTILNKPSVMAPAETSDRWSHIGLSFLVIIISTLSHVTLNISLFFCPATDLWDPEGPVQG